MSYSRLIHEYLDGQTDIVQEDILFAELAKNPDLRIEFNEQVQLQNVALTDMRTITPPAETTNAIFSKLGFTIPSKEFMNRISVASEGQVAIKSSSSFTSFLKKHSATLASIVITALLTTGIFMITDDRFQKTSDNNKIAMNKAEIPVVVSKNSSINNNNNIIKVSNSVNVSSFKHNDNLAANTPESFPAKDIEPVETKFEDRGISSFKTLTNSNQKINNSIMQVESPITDLVGLKPASNFNDGNFAIILTYQNTNPTNINIDSRLLNGFEANLSLTALYKIGDDWYIGGQFGKENIAMNFTRDLYGEQLNYQENPSLWFAGATVRWSPLIDNLIGISLNNMFRPFSQIMIGTTNNGGVLANTQIGIILTPYNNFAINLGYDYKAFFYSIDGKTENTIKSGATFGLGLSF